MPAQSWLTVADMDAYRAERATAPWYIKVRDSCAVRSHPLQIYRILFSSS